MTRKLRPDEVELWNRVASTADKLHNRNLPIADPEASPAASKPKKKPGAKPPVTPDRIPQFDIGQNAHQTGGRHDLLAPIGESLRQAPLRMDRKTHVRLKRGKLAPEGRIDLHGMTVDRAHPALTSFVLRAAADGKRLILVITGKGKDRDEGGPIPIRRGVLRHQVPHWLTVPPLAQVVLQITPAHDRHGGGGAYYVYLRKLR